MTKVSKFVPAAMEHEIFQEGTYRSLQKKLDDQSKFNRHYYGWTAGLLTAMVLGGGLAVYKFIESLPLPV